MSKYDGEQAVKESKGASPWRKGNFLKKRGASPEPKLPTVYKPRKRVIGLRGRMRKDGKTPLENKLYILKKEILGFSEEGDE